MAHPLARHALPETRRLLEAVLRAMPDHASYLAKSFRRRDEATRTVVERAAALLTRLGPTTHSALVEGYRWFCEMFREEQLHFQRAGRYRHACSAEANAALSEHPGERRKYLDGLLASQVLWVHHARTLEFYANAFLARLPDAYRHLEVGPGAGLQLHFAAVDPRAASITSWDVSPECLAITRRNLRKLGVHRPVKLCHRDVMDAPRDPGAFDCIVISEVLEHLDDPAAALSALRRCISDRGYLFVNVPVNAPAIDHVFLLRSPEEVLALIEGADFVVERALFAPVAGYTLARARRLAAPVSVAVAARPAARVRR